ncbi:DNA polymerase III subunit alpha [Thermosediminibacter oceani]|uniref:DNA polymerase III subunit alpha n=1 Tax=Thermosediminibacter oceani (strain ATCC BAA-1034 / DSM 16646 / JW/IW-1228P) TaxID=555079 RepID=D9RZI9_THEOJ|nr:DNA polymerase III subunit alpha [Thermosediminibacter oceani]ADL06887.1 DNA polymerase III, alpha subunit [Thermosediminibacter oceani DSM 16646]
MAFCHLHVHSEYSLLDGLCRLPLLVKKAAELAMPALALTDHGGLYGMVPFYRLCLEAGIKPILGCEVYVVEDVTCRWGKESFHHLVLLSENQEGFKNLLSLVTRSHVDGFYYRPRVDKKLLASHAKGLIALSGCIRGQVADLILRGDVKAAEEAAKEYADIFGRDNFFLELQYHGLAAEKKANFWMRSIAERLGIGLVATNDVHYLQPSDAGTHRVLLAVQTLSALGEAASLPGNQHYLKSPAEMEALFREIPGALENTVAIAERCDVRLPLGGTKLPEIALPEGVSADDYLRKLCFQGAAARYGRPLPQEVKDRLNYELSVIKKTGYAGYFLIVKDIVDFARKRGIIVGAGRGSAAGSLAAYVLGITDVDPLKYGLIFERFLNPERISPPDIDIDLCHLGRREVLEYIRHRFGRERIAHVGAFSTLQARAALRDTGRALGLAYEKIDAACSRIPYSHINLEDALKESPHLSSLVKNDAGVRRAFAIARKLQGLPRHMTQHSAGVAIADRPLTEYVPLQRASGEEIITQADMYALEELGLVKIDLLGLRFLTVIGETLKLVRDRYGIDMKPEEIPLDDEKTYMVLARGDTGGCFQLESGGMRKMLRRIKPKNIEDLSAVLALYRPGPLKSGMAEEFIARRQGIKPVSYIHPALEPVLRDTYGVFVYQEQLMQAACLISGYTPGEADLLRRAIAKKKKDEIEREKPRFLKRAVERGIDEKTAGELFATLEAFGDYGFNKSHSISYAVMAYRTVYLREHFPLEYFASLFNLYMDTPSRLQLYLCEARRREIRLLLPDINMSGAGFVPEGGPHQRAIRAGLALIKNLGPRGMEEILQAREDCPFTGFFDFCRRVDRRVINARALESLVFSGAFDSFGIPRPALIISLKWMLSGCSGRPQNQLCLLNENPDVEALAADLSVADFTPSQKMAQEMMSMGYYITAHPMEFIKGRPEETCTHTASDVEEIGEKQRVRISGILLDLRSGRTRSGERMLFARLEDLTGSVELVIFPRQLRLFAPWIYVGSVVLVEGWVDLNDDGHRTVVAEEIRPLTGCDLTTSREGRCP